jgi:hypothetical protein
LYFCGEACGQDTENTELSTHRSFAAWASTEKPMEVTGVQLQRNLTLSELTFGAKVKNYETDPAKSGLSSTAMLNSAIAFES